MSTYTVMAVAALAVLGMNAGYAQAEDWRSGLYIKGAGGWNYSRQQDMNAGAEASFKDGYVFSGAVGAELEGGRIEAEIAYRHADVDRIKAGARLPDTDGTLLSTAAMVNGYIDIPTATPVTPYVGVGIGVARVNVNGYTSAGVQLVDEKDTVFAYQGIAGASYAVWPDVDLFGEYRYFATTDVDLGTAGDANYSNHALMVGAVYRFQ